MKNITKAAALLMTLVLAVLLTACGTPAPTKYSLSEQGMEIDSLTAVVGERAYAGTGSGSVAGGTAYKYSGFTDAISDLIAYAEYLRGQGYIECFAVPDAQLCMVKRMGDGGALLSARVSGNDMEIRYSWQNRLELFYGQTKYVSGSALAILPSSEMVVFEYPVLGDNLPATETVNQYILDGVNMIIQHAKEMAAGEQYKLMGRFSVDSALASNSVFRLVGELTVGGEVKTLTATVTLTSITSTPGVQYSDITVTEGAAEPDDGAVG